MYLYIFMIFVYYVAVRTIILCYRATGVAQQGLLSFMISIMALYMFQLLHVVDFLGSRRMETAPTSIEVHPSNYEPGATLLNFSDRAQAVERTPYSCNHGNLQDIFTSIFTGPSPIVRDDQQSGKDEFSFNEPVLLDE